MLNETIRIKKLRPDALLPTYGSKDAAGADLYALTEEAGLCIAPGETAMVHTGLANCHAASPGLCMPEAALQQNAASPLQTRSA